MADQLTDRIAEVLLHHRFDGYMYECSCQRDLPDNEVLAMDREEHATHVAEAVVAALELRDTVRLLQAAGTWIAGAVSEDPSGEPWLMTRTLLNELFSRVDALGGWPQWVGVLGEEQGRG